MVKPVDQEEAEFEAEFEARLQSVLTDPDPALPVRPFLHTSTTTIAVLDRTGKVHHAGRAFNDWLSIDLIDANLCEQVLSQKEAAHALVQDKRGHPLLLTYAPATSAVKWPNLQAAAQAALAIEDRLAFAAISFSHMEDELEYSARALGLSNLEARVCAALFVHGSAKRAASHAGVTYHTARKALSGAMKTLGVSRQTALVRKLSELTTGSAPSRDAVERTLIDIFDLTKRDAKLIHLLCEGHSRSEAAEIAAISKAVAKDRFSHIFDVLGIHSATEIPRLVMEAFASALLTQNTSPVVMSDRRDKAPLKLLHRPGGGLVAVSDYGPSENKPVLIVHSSLSTRHPFRKVIHELQASGFRPITIDRPGFGLTDNLPEEVDRFETGTQDVVHVCDMLGIDKIDIITRGGAFHTLALARHASERLGRIIVINPDLLQHHCSKRQGKFGLVRATFDRYPNSIERVVRWTCSHLSRKRVETIIRAGIGTADADLASFDNRENMEDYARSILAFSTGRLGGFIREQRGYVLQKEIEGLKDASNWTIVLGSEDPLHNVDEILTFWKSKLPGATLHRINDAGRFISLSHTQRLIEML